MIVSKKGVDKHAEANQMIRNRKVEQEEIHSQAKAAADAPAPSLKRMRRAAKALARSNLSPEKITNPVLDYDAKEMYGYSYDV